MCFVAAGLSRFLRPGAFYREDPFFFFSVQEKTIASSVHAMRAPFQPISKEGSRPRAPRGVLGATR